MPAPVLINYAVPALGLFLAMSQFSIVSFRGEGIEVKHASEGGNCGSGSFISGNSVSGNRVSWNLISRSAKDFNVSNFAFFHKISISIFLAYR